MRPTIIYWDEPIILEKIKVKRTPKIVDNSKKIERLQKKIEALKNRWTRSQTPTPRRLRILDGYNQLIESYEKEIKELWWETMETNHDLEMRIKSQMFKGIPWYFPTPKEIVEIMIELADIKDWDYILEPSAWTWSILEWIVNTWKDVKIRAVEYNYWNYEILRDRFADYANITCEDFMRLEDKRWFDKIIMNPPFENRQDQIHIMRAWNMLKDWGILVAIASNVIRYRTDYASFKHFVESNWYIQTLPDNSFRHSWTDVNTSLIYLTK